MDFDQNVEIHRKLHSAKEDILKQLRGALKDAGLEDIYIGSVHLYLKRPPVQCPVGTEPVWEPETLADGTVIYRWVCK